MIRLHKASLAAAMQDCVSAAGVIKCQLRYSLMPTSKELVVTVRSNHTWQITVTRLEPEKVRKKQNVIFMYVLPVKNFFTVC